MQKTLIRTQTVKVITLLVTLSIVELKQHRTKIDTIHLLIMEDLGSQSTAGD